MNTSLCSGLDQLAGYDLRPFEKHLAQLERSARVAPERLAFYGSVEGKPTHQFYFDRFFRLRKDRTLRLIDQAAISPDGHRGAAHNYLTHGLHSYKGKFFPQIVRSVLNLGEVVGEATVVDPFVGSGTTTLEAAIMGFAGHGVDRNPLAALIARTKRSVLSLDEHAIEEMAADINALTQSPHDFDLPNRTYLERWFPPETLRVIENIFGAIEAANVPSPMKDLARLTLSSLLRHWSFQKPSQLRVYRRKAAPPASELLRRFIRDLERNATQVAIGIQLLSELQISVGPVSIYEGDARTEQAWPHPLYDAMVTSPPYATALPYIDTDRLSIFALGLADVADRSALEWSMIGNREIRKRQRIELEDQLLSNLHELPAEVVSDIHAIKAANDRVGVGFRRQNLPALLYRYFADMKTVFRRAVEKLAPGALCAVVIGDSYTIAGNERFRIRTADFLCEIAEQFDIRLQERVFMGGQTAYLPHQRNSISLEEILLLRAPGHQA